MIYPLSYKAFFYNFLKICVDYFLYQIWICNTAKCSKYIVNICEKGSGSAKMMRILYRTPIITVFFRLLCCVIMGVDIVNTSVKSTKI